MNTIERNALLIEMAFENRCKMTGLPVPQRSTIEKFATGLDAAYRIGDVALEDRIVDFISSVEDAMMAEIGIRDAFAKPSLVALGQQRVAARKAGNYALADELRAQIEGLGATVEDRKAVAS